MIQFTVEAQSYIALAQPKPQPRVRDALQGRIQRTIFTVVLLTTDHYPFMYILFQNPSSVAILGSLIC